MPHVMFYPLKKSLNMFYSFMNIYIPYKGNDVKAVQEKNKSCGQISLSLKVLILKFNCPSR